MVGSFVGGLEAFVHPSAVPVTIVCTGTATALLGAPARSILGTERYERLRAHSWLIVFFLLSGELTASAAVGGTATLLNWLMYHMPGQYVNWAAVAVLPLGYVAHLFKKGSPYHYGIVEIVAGVATAFGVTIHAQFQPVQILTIIGAIYVVARGFNNVAEARKKQDALSTDPSESEPAS